MIYNGKSKAFVDVGLQLQKMSANEKKKPQTRDSIGRLSMKYKLNETESFTLFVSGNNFGKNIGMYKGDILKR